METEQAHIYTDDAGGRKQSFNYWMRHNEWVLSIIMIMMKMMMAAMVVLFADMPIVTTNHQTQQKRQPRHCSFRNGSVPTCYYKETTILFSSIVGSSKPTKSHRSDYHSMSRLLPYYIYVNTISIQLQPHKTHASSSSSFLHEKVPCLYQKLLRPVSIFGLSGH